MLDRLGISALIGTALLIGAIDLHSQAPATPRAVADGLELTIDAVHDAFRSHPCLRFGGDLICCCRGRLMSESHRKITISDHKSPIESPITNHE